MQIEFFGAHILVFHILTAYLVLEAVSCARQFLSFCTKKIYICLAHNTIAQAHSCSIYDIVYILAALFYKMTYCKHATVTMDITLCCLLSP